MPLIKIKVKFGTANKIMNVERTLPNIYEVFCTEITKKYPEFPFNVFYKFKETTIQITDNATLLQSIDDCIKNKQAFLQLEGEKKEEAKVEEKKQEVKKEEPKKQEEVKKVEEKKPEMKKEEPKKVEEKKPEIKKEEPKKQEEVKKPKFCSNCGAKLEGGRFCSECGAPTGENPQPAQNKQNEMKKEEEKKEEPKPQHRPTTPPKDVLENDEMKCPKCQKMVGAGVKALGHFWHSECFTCSVCDQKFGGERKLMEHNGKPICSICYDETCTARCFKCGKALIGKYLVIDGHNYHQNCFVCTRCGKPFTSSYMLIGGQPVCKKCV